MSTSNLKISIAALSLCVSAVAIYIHLPYVIAAVSGSGAIEALPLAIFAVSTAVALISTIYLIRLAVSKEEPQKSVTFGTQPNSSVSAPPPPPPLPSGGWKNGSLPKSATTGEKSSVCTTKKYTLDPDLPSEVNKEEHDKFKKELLEKLKSIREKTSGKQEDDVQQPNKLEGVYDTISNMIPPPRSRSSSVSSNGSEKSEQDWSDNESTYSTPKNLQLDSNKKRDNSDSGIGSRSTSPLEKPLVPPKPANLKTGPQAPSATTVTNEAGKLPASSVKERCGMFGGADTKFKRGSVLVR